MSHVRDDCTKSKPSIKPILGKSINVRRRSSHPFIFRIPRHGPSTSAHQSNRQAKTRQDKKILSPFAPPGRTTRHRLPLDRRGAARGLLRPLRRRLPLPAHFSLRFRLPLRLGRVLDDNHLLAAAAASAGHRSTANTARTRNPDRSVFLACAVLAVLARRLFAGVLVASTPARVLRHGTGSVHVMAGTRGARSIATASWGTWISSHVPERVSRSLALSWYRRCRDRSRRCLAVGARPGILARRAGWRSRCRIRDVTRS